MSLFVAEADELADQISRSDLAMEYHRCRRALNEDEDAQKTIKKFVKKKEEFEEVERFGRYHPDHDRVKKEMREVKREMDLHDKVVAFKKAEKELEKLLNEISQILAISVSEQIKVPTGNPFWDQMGCGGSGCGSGGCGSGGG
ncbi:YlbF family regulator [Caldalkalibacillus salinus]|uniref:YlbF family regulator n=1 Tax=Caldalkalibacillus salinus TaxID=2803787 RepID=UPI001922AB0B|nr:YlbF family regulator [Caldalkalibacillus salinus]